MADFYFTDSETRSLVDVTQCGAYAYAQHPSTEATVWGYATEEGQPKVWSPSWAWGNLKGTRADAAEPTELLDHVADGGYIVAWNAAFDRHIWNQVMVPKYGWPGLPLEQVLCAQVQAEANNLPGGLAKACETLGTHFRKDPKGKQLINMLCTGERSTWNIQDEIPERMGHFRAYCGKDCIAMREVWQHTRPLTLDEWAEYHVSESINDRGVAVDTTFAEAASKYAAAETSEINAELFELTGDERLTVTAHLRKAEWLFDQLWPDEELQQLVKKKPKENGKPRYSCDRPTREAVLDIICQPEHAGLFEPNHAEDITRFLELIEAGNSAAVHKFKAIANQSYSGRVYGAYAFNGAGQTGRYSSRGVQLHNLIRDPVEKGNPNRALDAIDDIVAGQDPGYLVEEYGYPVSRLLARLLRPTFMAANDKTLVWADWDQIEGRVLPWLSNSRGGETKLEIYRAGADVYRITAGSILGIPSDDIDDFQRQAYGKVPELALGFGGAAGALSAMARGYGVLLGEEQKGDIVKRWRANNAWCVDYWSILWDAAMAAFAHPGTWYPAGRVKYLYHPNLMRGTLICELPCGRWLVYPQFRRERVEVENSDGEKYTRWRTSFVKGFGSGSARVDLWYGVLAENVTQGVSASMLRLALTRMARNRNVVLHTHDEIVCEVPGSKFETAEWHLTDAMTILPDWAEGLPLSVSVESGPYYTK